MGTTAASWPPSVAPNQIATSKIGFNAYLPNLLAFGTDGVYFGIIVKDIRATPMISEVTCENGSGFTAASVVINDGDLVELVCVDDRNYVWPITGGTITVLNPQPNGTYAASELFQVYNNNYSVAQKAFGERSIIAKKYTLITPVQL
jgi:hypothetical protein